MSVEGLLSAELLAEYGEDVAGGDLVVPSVKKNKKKGGKGKDVKPQPVKSKSQTRKERLIELRKVKAARRKDLFASLESNSMDRAQLQLLQSSGKLGQKESLKKRLERVVMEKKVGIEVTDTDKFVIQKEIEVISSASASEESEAEQETEVQEDVSSEHVSLSHKRSHEEMSAGDIGYFKPGFEVLGKRGKKKRRTIIGAAPSDNVEEKQVEMEEEPTDSTESFLPVVRKKKDDENVVVDAFKLPKEAMVSKSQVVPSKKKFWVTVNRTESIDASRKLLPIYGEEQVLIETINENPFVVVCGATGSGKTTQLPQFLLENGYGYAESGHPGMIAVTQPRRIAAVSTANRVAQELGDHGHLVGYHIRFDRTAHDKETKIKFMTDGILLKEIQADFLLQKYSVVLIDEAHERNLNTDVLIGLLSRIVPLRQKKGLSPLKVVIMSATLRVGDFTENRRLFPRHVPPVIEIGARQFPVVNHFNRVTPLTTYVDAAFKKVCKIHSKLPPGGILVFLTGKQEIEHLCKELNQHFSALKKRVKYSEAQTEFDNEAEFDGDVGCEDEVGVSDVEVLKSRPSSVEAMEKLLQEGFKSENKDSDEDKMDLDNDGDLHAVRDVRVLPLYGLLSTEMQMQVFDSSLDPTQVRLIVVATNVAETSITIPGIKYVVDCGREKRKVYDKVTGMSTFVIDWVSQASADQRSGRAGRTGPGHCYRLFSSAVFNDKFPQFSDPEILNIPIDGMVLQLKSMGIHDVLNFPFPTIPEVESIQSALNLLQNIAAMEVASGKLTELGETLANFPVSPRYAKMLALSNQGNCLPYMVAIVAILSVGNLWKMDVHHETDVPDKNEEEDVEEDSIEDFPEGDVSNSKSKRQKAYNESRRFWSHRKSDLLGDMNIVLGSDYASNLDDFCNKYFIRKKALLEIRNLRKQLTRILQPFLKGDKIRMLSDDRFGEEDDIDSNASSLLDVKDLKLQPPSEQQEVLLCQIIASGFLDQTARKWTNDSPPLFGDAKGGAYECVLLDRPVYIHPHSHMFDKTYQPEMLVYHELTLGRTGKTFVKGITAITLSMLSNTARDSPLCFLSKPLESPAPYVDPKLNRMVGFVRPYFGPRKWKLPIIKVNL
jgi:ATP-dependent RNA helicase DHX37/DHR1